MGCWEIVFRNNFPASLAKFFSKGLADAAAPIRVFTVQGDLARGHAGQLTLRHGQHVFTIGDGVPTLVMGRDERCDIVVKSYFASRRHAVIELSRDRFVLTDQSSNGTFVTQENGHEIFLKRESLPLIGEGSVSLGAAPSDDDSYTVHFQVIDTE